MTPDRKAAKRQRRTLPTTARGIDALRPEAQPVDWFDATQKGISLALHVSPGGGKTWYLFYSVHGRPKRLKLGTYPALSLADARELAWSEKKRIQRDGVDPVAEKRAARAAAERARAETIDALIDIYIERYAKRRKRTWRDDRTMLTREVLPTWKGRPVTSITRRDCRELLNAIADRGAPIFTRVSMVRDGAARVGAQRELLLLGAPIVSADPPQHRHDACRLVLSTVESKA